VGVTKYNAGTAVTITAYPASSYAFQNWMIDGAPYPTNPVTVIMDMDHTVLAQFAAIPPPPTHTLSIASNLSGFYATVNGSQKLVPYSEALTEGSYTLAVPSNLTVGSDIYNFTQWADGPTSPTRTIQLTADTPLTAIYTIQAPPPPAKGNIEVHAFLDTQEVVAPGSVVETGEAFNTPATLPENLGTYVVKVTIGGETKQQTVTVTSGQTIRLDFQFTTLPPISPISPGLILSGLFVGGVILSSTPK
jgi:hypothetical protein